MSNSGSGSGSGNDIVAEFNLYLSGASGISGISGVRIMRYARCVAYVFEDSGRIQVSERQQDMVKRLAKESGEKVTLLDLTACKGANSTVIAFWADIITQVKLNGGRVIIVGANEFVSRSLRMVGLDRLCGMAQGMEQALAMVAQEPGGGG